jgi:ABC-type polysaccharide/polyol phosphate transport system ATPase subunit/ABC-type polysaccharide/polyol phosphate export permease
VSAGESGPVALERPQGAREASAVSVRGVSKSFVVPRHRAWTLKERLRHPIASLGHDRSEVLHDVSFEVAPGEFFAVIGRNGSGKSTLLRCIAGIYELDGGEVDVSGPIAPFIELGVGFQPQLAAEDNVIMAGTLMGMQPAEAKRRFPQVISFAELEEFAEMPIVNYSSGMQVRLAFSTSFQADAEVLLFDEVLAVGDALFQRKCKETFDRLVSTGHTIVYVSHSLDTVAKFADRVLLLDEGRMIALGEPEEVLEVYEQRNRERAAGRRPRPANPDGHADVVGAWLEAEDGQPLSVLRQGEHANFRFVVRLKRDAVPPTMGFALRDDEGRVVLSETDRWRAEGTGRAGELRTYSAMFPSGLSPGAYELAPLLIPRGEEAMLEVKGSALPVRVQPGAADSPVGSNGRPGRSGGGAWSEAKRFGDIVRILARTDFKLRYLDSIVGYAWAVMQPLLIFAVLYVIWTQIFSFRDDTPHYAINLLLGLALFTFFSEACGHALTCLVTKGSILRKIPFPPIALPLASVLNSAYVYGLSLVVVLGFILASGIPPEPDWLEVVPLFLLLGVFTGGVAMLLSLLYVVIRDIQQIWVVVTRLLFFATPIFYPVEIVPEGLRHILMLNPLAVMIVQSQHVLTDSGPSAADAAGGPGLLALSVTVAIGSAVAGFWLYRAKARRLIERT